MLGQDQSSAVRSGYKHPHLLLQLAAFPGCIFLLPKFLWDDQGGNGQCRLCSRGGAEQVKTQPCK